jgi:hypothetical protein
MIPFTALPLRDRLKRVTTISANLVVQCQTFREFDRTMEDVRRCRETVGEILIESRAIPKGSS